MTMATTGIGLERLQHLVLWVSDVERSVRFYCDVLGLEVQRRLGLFEQTGVPRPDGRVARMYHSAWEVGDITDLVRARQRLIGVGALVGSSSHGVSLSLYAKDPDGVPDGVSAPTRALDLEGELARRGIAIGP